MIYKDERIKKTFDMVDFWDKFDTIKNQVKTIDRLGDTDAYMEFHRLWSMVEGLHCDIDEAERNLTARNESYRKRPITICQNCGKKIYNQFDWDFDEDEREPICSVCGSFLDLPEGY